MLRRILFILWPWRYWQFMNTLYDGSEII